MNSMNKILSAVILWGLILLCSCSTQPSPIRSGELWPDNNGEHINAHGGGVMYHDGT